MDIAAIKAQIDTEIQKVDSLPALEEFRVKYLGRKGLIAQLTASLATIPSEGRANFGQQVNALKNTLSTLIAEKQKSLTTATAANVGGAVDIGLPGISQELGRLHPLTQMIDEICLIFVRLGFSVVEGPEIETEYNNFTALNIPAEHPSRDVFDTFYINQNLLLRSHTSPVQIRVMKSQKPPLAVVVPGRVYRPDAVDASHSFMFHQIEGFMVDREIRFSDLKGILKLFAQEVFGKEIKMRFRPHFFPFTEPSAEVDISCIICGGHQVTRSPGHQEKHCSVCGGKGWLEILGAGMIHPNVFKNVGYDPKKYTGFAFGLGVDRIAMLKYGIDDIRLFYENDLRFLKQF
ncbi:MAG: phenylalanine--tRNA ligase subunit alpha [Candidatus Omnitrophica bacterium]|nr:phenylalanine--tRNA ligase subunit alpha [Candidatus Omnitrophota bacterium]MBI5145377.1 phenylalanine--tRNA ligase subunit alpha [Candidatus Omnitrophota bacterium]